MTPPLAPGTTTRLEKVAIDNGFDQEFSHHGEWLGFSSTQAPLRIWLTASRDKVFIAAFSQHHVVRALGDYGTPVAASLPPGAIGGRTVDDIPALHHLVRRAFQLSTTLPDELLHTFERETVALPRTTEAERLVVQRVGQGLFRTGLLAYWEGRCAVTGLGVTELLRASHIKPWADCAIDAERLDVFNGLLLAPHLDALFDSGFITVADDGRVMVSPALSGEARQALAVGDELSVAGLSDGHRAYLAWHRARIFRADMT